MARYTFGIRETAVRPPEGFECWCGRVTPTFAGCRHHQSVAHGVAFLGRPHEYWRLVDAFYARYGRKRQ